ncbi:MAG: hypothetical protein R3E64_04060 [Halioglobus sp.]
MGKPVYPNYLLFTQGATNAMKVNPLTGLANAEYMPPMEWTERVMRLIGDWDNPYALDLAITQNSCCSICPFRDLTITTAIICDCSPECWEVARC